MLERLDSSPELMLLKKSAGRLIMRIIDAACTFMFILVFMRAVIIALTAFISSVLMDTHTVNTETAMSSDISPDSSTSLNSSLFIYGMNMPTAVAASVASAIIMKSDTDSVSAMYFTNSPMPIFLSGRGL